MLALHRSEEPPFLQTCMSGSSPHERLQFHAFKFHIVDLEVGVHGESVPALS